MIKAAVIGCGRMGAQPSARLEGQVPVGWLPISHVESLRATAGVELVALCDSSEEALQRWGSHYGIESLHTDYRELIDRVRPDVITIATRTPVKREIVQYACKNGVKGIYLEKPIANSIEDCKLMLAEVRAAKAKLAYGVNRRYHSAYRKARELIRGGEIGEVVEVVVEHGRSPLLWTHSHSVDLILFLSDSTELMGVQAGAVSDTVVLKSPLFVDSDPVLENAFFKFASGVTANIVRSGGLNVRVGGTAGNLTVHGNGAFIQISRKDAPHSPYFLEQKTVRSAVDQSATVIAMTELVQSIADGGDLGVSPAAIELGMLMLLGCTWSHLNRGAYVSSADIPMQLVVTGKSGVLYA